MRGRYQRVFERADDQSMLGSRKLIHHAPATFFRAGNDGDPVARLGQDRGRLATHLARAGNDGRDGVSIETLVQPGCAPIGQRSIGAWAGVRADASAEAKRAPEELVEDRSGGAVCQGRLVCGADLAQQLLLGDDRRVEAPDDLEHSPDGLTPGHIPAPQSGRRRR